MASFRRSVWLDDACFMLVMSYLMDKSDESLKQRGIGGVNPLYVRIADDSIKRSVIESTLPFEKGNKFVLNCGEDRQRVLRRACVKTRENSPACSTTRRHEQLWPTYFAIFRVFGLSLPVPTVSLESILYLRFRYMFLASKGGFCRNTDVDTGKADGTLNCI
ncbi:hypothetical protein GQ600_21348 [Phytophthora cactorum]|nr:hypothetical protein GQ600_21348 [Phytophthora cactorum]